VINKSWLQSMNLLDIMNYSAQLDQLTLDSRSWSGFKEKKLKPIIGLLKPGWPARLI